MSQRAQQRKPVPVRAGLRAGFSARGGDCPPGADGLSPAAEDEQAAGFFDFFHREPAEGFDSAAFEVPAQDVQHGRGLQAVGVDAAALQLAADKAERTERLHRLFRRKALQHGGRRGGVAVVARGRRVPVGQVAAAVARGQQLFAHARIFFKNRDFQPAARFRRPVRGGKSREQACGPAAEDRDVETVQSPAPLLFFRSIIPEGAGEYNRGPFFAAGAEFLQKKAAHTTGVWTALFPDILSVQMPPMRADPGGSMTGIFCGKVISCLPRSF